MEMGSENLEKSPVELAAGAAKPPLLEIPR